MSQMQARPWLLIAALMYVETIAAFETSMIYGAIGLLYHQIGDAVLVGWIITIYMLVSACLTPLIARLGDLYGRRMMLALVLFVVTIGSIVSALSPNIQGLLIGRGLQGLGGSILPLCLGLLREHTEPRHQTMGSGFVAATASIATGVGVLVGGLIADHMPWHLMFTFAAIASTIAIGVSIVAIPRSRAAKPLGGLDLLGGMLMIPMIAGCLFAIGQIKYWGIGDPRIAALIGGAMLIGMVWFWHEWRRPYPLIDVRLLGNPQVLLANLVMIISAYGVFQVGPFMSMLLQQTPAAGSGFGLSATLSGTIMFGAQLMALFGGTATGFVANRRGARRALQAGALIAALGWVGMALGQDHLGLLVSMLLLQSVGSVMILGATPLVLAESVPLDRTSEANGVTAVLRQANFAVATQLCAFLLSTQSVSVNGSNYPAPSAVGLTFAVLASATVIGFLVSLTLPRSGRKPTASSVPILNAAAR
ncbi:MAG: hypothetical protein JWQ90_453 [Hydrocarboniphaga sp.]|uniref:MFS transporter n=1 Tax=Hydrocarboniphaga sp. TaxID=2033016 RepID=UPI00261F1F35|nr:MFS transporter [Hydrocarboniphaga sp.]MDB5968003.1 hypothetical protein [Hydrocarboniphaga sp.]